MKKIVLLPLILFVLSTQMSIAQKTKEKDKKNSIITDKFDFEIGVFIPTKDVKISVNGSSVNNEINFNDSFGFKQNEVTPYFNFNWRFSRMWRLSAEYFQLKTSQRKELDEDVPWEDLIFKKGTYAEAGYGLNLFRVSVGRTIFKNEKQEIGGSIGIHAMNLSAYIEGQVGVEVEGDTTGIDGGFDLERSSVSAFVPLPNIGLFYIYALNSKWALSAEVDWFGLSVDEYSGSLWDVEAKINFKITDHFGARASYRLFAIDVKVDNDKWNGNVNFDFQGPTAGVYYGF